MGISGKKSKIILWSVCCLIAFAGSTLIARKATRLVQSRRATRYAASYSDYDVRAKSIADFVGPPVGTIDIGLFRGKDGEPLATS